MNDINLDRVEKRYTFTDVPTLKKILQNLGFIQKDFSDRSMTLTYFCDTTNFELPNDQRVKIRTYTNHVPKQLDLTATYKLNFKTHKEKSVSKKVSFEGKFPELLKQAQQTTALPLVPLMAMSYHREHYTIPGDEDVRVTIDQDIFFHALNHSYDLQQFFHYDTAVFEIKYNPNSTGSQKLQEKITSSINCTESFSKRITMYKKYKELGLTYQ